MTKFATAQAEIRAIYDNELECLDEGTPHKIKSLTLWSRTIRLQLRDGSTCVSFITYAIHADGYWEQSFATNDLKG